MTWTPCRKCGKPRSMTVVSSDGYHVPPCAYCGAPGYIEPHDDGDEARRA